MVRPESGDGEIVPILGSVVPRADELIRIPATAPRTPDQPHTRRGRVIGPGQNQIRTLTTDYSYRRLCDLNLGPATLCAGADREQQTILLSELHFL